MATRWGDGDERKARAALFLLLTLPGVAILYQGDEIALEDGAVPEDRILDIADPSRDPERTPLPWTRDGREWQEPWLPLGDTRRNVEDQRRRPEQHAELHARPDPRAQGVHRESYETLASAEGRLGLPPRRQDLRPQHDREARRLRNGRRFCRGRALIL